MVTRFPHVVIIISEKAGPAHPRGPPSGGHSRELLRNLSEHWLLASADRKTHGAKTKQHHRPRRGLGDAPNSLHVDRARVGAVGTKEIAHDGDRMGSGRKDSGCQKSPGFWSRIGGRLHERIDAIKGDRREVDV